MRLALSSLGLIFGLTGVIIGCVITFNPKPFVASYLGPLIFLVSAVILGYAIRSFVIWSKSQQKKLTELILSDTPQLVAHWHYPSTQWTHFFELELKKGRQGAFIALWISGFVLLLIVVLVMYFSADLQWATLRYVLLGFVPLMMVGYYLIAQFQNRKRRIFLEPTQPTIHLSLHGLLINKQWPVAFKKTHISLIEVDKINLHQETCLCFKVKTSSGEGDSVQKHHVPIPKNELGHLSSVLDAFQKDITIKP